MSKIDELIEKLCPNGVEHKKLKEICKFQNGFAFKSSLFKNSGSPILRITNINNGIISDSIDEYVYFDEKDYKENLQAYQVKKGDIVIAMSGATTGKIGYNYSGNIYFLNQRVGMFIPDEKFLMKRYLYHWLCGQSSNILNRSSGTGAQPNLSSVKMMDFQIPVPQLEIQEEIVRILDDFTLLSAELSAELKARQKQYEYYRNEIIKTCEGKKGKLIELLSQPITDGPHTTPKLYPTGIPFVSATAVYNGKVHLEDAKGYISREFDNECAKKYKPRRNDVYMVKSGSTTGKVAYVDFDADFNIWSPLAAMRTDNEKTSRYLYHLLQTTDVQNQVVSRMSHGSQPNLSMRVLEQFDVKIPDLTEQTRIVNILDKLDFICNDMFSGIPAEIEARQKQYEYYRDKLLTFKELKVEN